MQTDNARSVERQLSMLLSLTAKLLHVVILKRLLNLFMAENNSESIGVDPPPLQHRHTWNGYLFTGSCCSRGRVPFVLLLDLDFGVFEIETQTCASFFRGTHLVTDLKPLAPHTDRL